MKRNQNPQVVKSAARVLDIFELLRDEGKPLTLTDMSRKLAIPLSSMHGLVQTLVSRHYLLRDDMSQTYQLGPALMTLAAHTQDGTDLIEAADFEMEELSRKAGESVSLAVLEEQEVVFIHKKVSGQIVRVVNPVGTQRPAHATALGKCLLAWMSDEQLFSIYPSEELAMATKSTLPSRTELIRELATVRAYGVAYDREESAMGVVAVGSPIRDHTGLPIAAVSIAAPTARATSSNIEAWERMIKSGAFRISILLGYRS